MKKSARLWRESADCASPAALVFYNNMIYKRFNCGTKFADTRQCRGFSHVQRRRHRHTMKLLSALLTFVIVCAIILMMIPVLTAGLALVVVAGCFFVWFLPILLILGSDVTSGGEKFAWILAIVFLSWFAWIFYFLLAPLKPRNTLRY